MPVNVRWVKVRGQLLLSVTLPDNQHVIIEPRDAWTLLLYLRDAMRRKPPMSWPGR